MTQCCVEVPTKDLFMHYHQCQRRAKVERNGKWYCAQHDPDRIAQRRREAQARFEAEWTEKRRARERQSAEQEACEGVPIEQLRPGLLKELLEAR